LINRFIYF